MSGPLLSVRNLHAWRQTMPVLLGIDLDVDPGEAVAVTGDNGAGKSSLFAAIVGQVASRGTIDFDGRDLGPLSTHRRIAAGIGYSPEGRHVFAGMTVTENLQVAVSDAAGRADRVRSILSAFPELQVRRDSRAWQLSGGEQQMLALGRAIANRPRLLLLDEPTLGLAPEARARLTEIVTSITRQGIAILVADQDADFLQSICNRSILLSRGSVLQGESGGQSESRPTATHK